MGMRAADIGNPPRSSPFLKMDDAQSEVVRGPPRRGAGLSRALLPEWPRAAPTVLAPSKKRLLINGTYFSSTSLKNCSGTSDIGMNDLKGAVGEITEDLIRQQLEYLEQGEKLLAGSERR